MKRIVRGGAVVATLVVLALSRPALAGDEGAAAQSPGDGWRTVIYPVYGWLPLYRAKTRLPEDAGSGGGDGTLREGTTDSELDQAVLAGIRVDKGRFSLEGGFLYAGLSAERDSPLVKTEVDTSLADLRIGYEIAPDFHVEAGARYLALNMKATIDDLAATWKPDLLQPVIGLTYRPRLGRNWRLVLHGDVGGVITGDGMTAAATARIEWQPLKHFLLSAGGSVMYLKTEGEIASRDVELDQTLYGPVIGIGIPF